MRKLRLFGTATLALALGLLLLSGAGALRPSFAANNYGDLDLLPTVIHLVKSHYVTDVDERELVEGAVKGMLDVLDPHTTYLSPELYEEVQRDTKGEFEGLGIEITQRDGFVTVVAPIDGTPAQQAGIRAADQIVRVCPDTTEESCRSTQDMNLIEAVKLMRGPRGTKIMIEVAREGWEAPKPFIIKRASIRLSSVSWHVIDSDIPYVRVSQFQERTAHELLEALEEVSGAVPHVRGLVLDLRDNPGGLLQQAVEVADVFLTDGLIVFSEGRGGGNRMEWSAKREGTQPTYPMVVLVNSGSASASEIVAGALQDHGRAVVLGKETFGKGSVQTIIPLDDGSGLRLTTALYYLPSGRSIQETRIQPDILEDPYTESEVAALREAGEQKSFGEEDLAGHFAAETTETAETPSEEEPVLSKEEAFVRRLPFDRQLSRAVDLLKSWTVFSKLELPDGS